MCYSLSVRERKIIDNFKKNNIHTCAYCGKMNLYGTDLTADHKLPVSRGGKTEDDNLCICCKSCNEEKANLTKEEYIEIIHKTKSLLGDDLAYTNLKYIYDGYKNVIESFNEFSKELSQYNKDKNEIESIIRDETCNASEGYLLYRDLKEVLIKIQDTQQNMSKLQSIYDLALTGEKELKEKMKEIKKSIFDKLKNDVKAKIIKVA